MKLSTSLGVSLNEQFNWNKCRMDCFIKMLIALFRIRTVNLRNLAAAMDSKAEVNSRYRRLQRFFALFHFDMTVLSRWLFQQFYHECDKVYIAIDRTNWFWGKKKINIFMLSVLYEGIAIPVCWHMLDKAGTSTGAEQRALIESFIKLFGKEQIIGVLGDREFANGYFFSWLKNEKIPFYIRIKSGSWACIKGRKWRKAYKIFKTVNPKSHYTFDMAIEIFGVSVFLAAARSEGGELMIVATNAHPKNAIAIYLRRWEIESLFQAFKSRGFNLEDTQLTEPMRLSKLIAVIAVAFTWAHKVGEWRQKIKPIRLRKMRKQMRPEYSLFKYGLELLTDCFVNRCVTVKKLREVAEILKSPTYQEINP